MTQNRQKPNILLVFSDQHRWCDLGIYGNDQVYSPHFDAFAESGIRFVNCISNSPVCVPARGTMLSGLYPLKHGAVTNDIPMNRGTESIAHVLAGAGYHTGYIGKWHLAGVPREQSIPAGAARFGFQEWKACNCNHRYMKSYYYDENEQKIAIGGYEPIAQTDLALDFIHRGGQTDEPWFLTLSWGPPHDPYMEVPQSYLHRYQNENIRLRDNVPDVVTATTSKRISKEEVTSYYKGYYAHITALDEQFGRLIDGLKESGQLSNTIIIYTSDHGDMLGSQGLTNKQLPYEESVKVPLIVYWEGHTAKGVSQELISLVDLSPSILGLAGLAFTNKPDGEDLHPLFTDPEAQGRADCYMFDYIPAHQAMFRGSREWRAIRNARYTFARTSDDQGYALYDNWADKYQQHNLIEDIRYKDIRESLLERLNELILQHDKLLHWESFIRHFGLMEQWNHSQSYFHLPLLE